MNPSGLKMERGFTPVFFSLNTAVQAIVFCKHQMIQKELGILAKALTFQARNALGKEEKQVFLQQRAGFS